MAIAALRTPCPPSSRGWQRDKRSACLSHAPRSLPVTDPFQRLDQARKASQSAVSRLLRLGLARRAIEGVFPTRILLRRMRWAFAFFQRIPIDDPHDPRAREFDHAMLFEVRQRTTDGLHRHGKIVRDIVT